MGLKYTVLDVFTKTKFAGNPLAIVHLETDESLNQEQKHRITKEFNLSETVFLHPATREREWRIDIFTPGAELPFAGHPTIGSAILVGELYPRLSEITLITQAGSIPIRFCKSPAGDAVTASASVPHNVRTHSTELRADHVRSMQGGLRSSSLNHAPWPVVSITNGMTFALIKLETMDELRQVEASPSNTAKDLVSLDEGWTTTFVGSLFWVLHPDSSASHKRASCRMIDGLLEDPATGSANCALASYLALQEAGGNGNSHIKLESMQGYDMRRPSDVTVTVSVEQGRIQEVLLEGTAVRVMDGTLYP